MPINNLAKTLLESIERPAFIKNKVGIYIGCNNAFEKFLGINKYKILGQSAFEIAPISLARIYSAADAHLYATRHLQIYKSMVSTATQDQIVMFHKMIFLSELDEAAGFIGIIDSAQPSITPNQKNLKSDGSSVDLTKRELSALQLMAKGMTTKEIAKILLISNFTANDYMKSIFLKLGANNRVTALLLAQKLCLV